jgi:excisionase family DNA binding protein
MDGQQFLTPAETARCFRVSIATIRRRCRDGSLRHRRVGRQLRIPACVLLENSTGEAGRGMGVSIEKLATA